MPWYQRPIGYQQVAGVFFRIALAVIESEIGKSMRKCRQVISIEHQYGPMRTCEKLLGKITQRLIAIDQMRQLIGQLAGTRG